VWRRRKIDFRQYGDVDVEGDEEGGDKGLGSSGLDTLYVPQGKFPGCLEH
jgi:hypothetical protein